MLDANFAILSDEIQHLAVAAASNLRRVCIATVADSAPAVSLLLHLSDLVPTFEAAEGRITRNKEAEHTQEK